MIAYLHRRVCVVPDYGCECHPDEKHARRTATFAIQNKRYEGSIRRSEKYGANPVLTAHLGYDMGSDMHCRHARKTAREHGEQHDERVEAARMRTLTPACSCT